MPKDLKNLAATDEMQVTNIRLERSLKEKLKSLAGSEGYQALIRDVLWDYVWDESFNRTQYQLVAMARKAKQEIAAGQAREMDYEQL